MSDAWIERIAYRMAEALTPDWNAGLHWCMNPSNRARHCAAVHAVLTTMRDPSPAMIDAIADAKMDFDEPTADDCIAVWRAGIDAALNSDVKPA